jgi:hypothetical protein
MTSIRRLLLVLPALAACALALLDARAIPDLFLKTDPTLQGSFSLLHLRPFVSVLGHAAVVLMALHQMFRSAPTASAARTAFRTALVALGLEALALAPCALARDALCGVFYIFVGEATGPVMLAAFIFYLARAGDPILTRASAAAAVLLACGAAAAYWQLTPQSAAACEAIGDELKRGTCIMNIALRDDDAALCDRVSFDSSRWSCLYQVAERQGQPALCERITAPCRYTSPGLQCDPQTYRDLCYLVVARKLKDQKWCARIAAGDKRSSCLQQSGR